MRAVGLSRLTIGFRHGLHDPGGVPCAGSAVDVPVMVNCGAG